MNVCGLEVEDLPDGYAPLEAIVFVKTMDDEGFACWCRRGTTGLTDEEVVGILTADSQRIVADINSRWLPEGDE